MRATVFFVVIAVLLLIGIILLLRSGRLKEKYSAFWLAVGVVCIVLAAWPRLLAKAAALIGIQVPSNLLFALAIILLLAVCLQQSLALSRQEERIRRLAEELAILRSSGVRDSDRRFRGGLFTQVQEPGPAPRSSM